MTKKSDPVVEGLAEAVAPVSKWTEEHRASSVKVDGHVVSAETRARIVDLCNHAIRVDAGGTGKLAKQILVDLCLVDLGA